MDNAVVIKDLSVTLSSHIPVLQHIDVNLPEGKIVGFIGPSGAGKTTLMRAIVGRQKISQGHVTVLGYPAGSANLRQQLSYMTQERSIYPDLTVGENIHYFATMFGLAASERKLQINQILKTLDLNSQSQQLASRLSGGQKQRVSLAISLIGSPKLMILDEPTVGLDPMLRQQLWQLFHQLRDQGATLIISSHVMEEAQRCDDLLLLRNGQVLAHNSPAELMQQTKTTNIEQAFLALVEEANEPN